MATHTRIWIALLAFSFPALPVTADTVRVTLETDIVDKDEKKESTDILTVDGDKKFRIDFLGPDKKRSSITPYLLTVDGGSTWVMGNEAEAFCGQVDTGKFFAYLGGLALRVEEMANVEIVDAEVKKVLDEEGAAIHGHPTNHIRLVTTAHGKAAIFFKTYEDKIHVTKDIWYTTDLDMHPVRRQWLDALSATGAEGLDRLLKQQFADISGAILKQETVIKLMDVKKNEEELTTKKTRFITIEKLNPSDITKETFRVPECKKMKKKEMRKSAEKLFKRGKII